MTQGTAAYCHKFWLVPRCRALTRTKISHRRIALPQAIAALTSEPAALAGLNDRGRLAVGLKADLNLIDFDRLKVHVPTVVHDLPAGGRRMRQLADGDVATIVSGQVTYRNGEPTGALPGRLVRGQRGVPALA